MTTLIGITGGIGSGKTTVAGLFATLNIPVYDADARAKALMSSDPELMRRIRDLMGAEAYLPDGTLHRAWIASRIFSDRTMLEQFNNLVHPAVYADLLAWSSLPGRADAPYLLQESAILFEENLTARFQAIILVTAPEELRIGRVIQRDGVSREQVLTRMRHQWPDAEKSPLSDYVIFNDGLRPLIRQVMDIDTMIRARRGPQTG